jgi:hypothetical protein
MYFEVRAEGTEYKNRKINYPIYRTCLRLDFLYSSYHGYPVWQ